MHPEEAASDKYKSAANFWEVVMRTFFGHVRSGKSVRVSVVATVVAAFGLLQIPASAAWGVECQGERATIIGTARHDRLVGTKGNDVIVGFDGDDTIISKEGADIICADGEQRNDNSDDFNDYVVAGSGHDKVDAGIGDDIVRGGDGRDEIIGGEGDDRLIGAKAPSNDLPDEGDVIFGEAGEDWIDGNEGPDRIYGGTGDDILSGGKKNDWLNGGADNDELLGGKAEDVLAGAEGSDTLFGAQGDDQLNGVDSVVANDTLDAGTEDHGDTCSADLGDSLTSCEFDA
jgi:Ca2+-binding RTX toxin-like protein